MVHQLHVQKPTIKGTLIVGTIVGTIKGTLIVLWILAQTFKISPAGIISPNIQIYLQYLKVKEFIIQRCHFHI